MSNVTPAFVFVHGAWHNAATWHLVTPLLEARGYVVRALDLPGAGRNAKAPRSYGRRPLDLAAFAIERSPNAEVSQQDRTRAVVALINEMTRNQARPVVLVGHSLGGLTVSAVAEAIPERVSAVVYLTAFLLPSGMTAHAMIEHPTMADSVVPSLFLADPGLVQAMRIDPRNNIRHLQTSEVLGCMSNAGVAVNAKNPYHSLNVGSVHPPQTQGKVQSAVRLALSGRYLLQASARTGLIDCQMTSKVPEEFILPIMTGLERW